MEIFVKHRNFGQKSKFKNFQNLVKILRQKWEFWSKMKKFSERVYGRRF